jgi:D-alanyl-D-alanine carboxypeptidase
MALIKNAAIAHPLYVEIISTAYFELPPTNMYEEMRTMRNSNLMVRPANENFNPRAVGGKTGFTNAAQHTLISYAEYNGLEIIISVLYASPRGTIFTDTAALIEYIFANFPLEEPTEELTEEPADFLTEAVPVFAYSQNYTPLPLTAADQPAPPLPHTQEISTAEAAAVASASAVLAVAVIILIKIFDKSHL